MMDFGDGIERQPLRDWLAPVYFVNINAVNINDIIGSSKRPGAIIRCRGSVRDAVLVVDSSGASYEFVAGMIDGDAK